MAEIIEILFEQPDLKKTVVFLMEVNFNAILLDFQVASETNDANINLQLESELFNSIDNSSDGLFSFNFSEFKLQSVELSWIGIQLYKYDSKYDLNCSFNLNELERLVSLSSLRDWAELVSKEVNAKSYYGGYEPAVDEETRFFTGKNLGPLKFIGN